MRLLILGGTQFVGRHITQAALNAGHQVTLFNRGRSHPELFPQAEKLSGDRNGGLDVLEGAAWDAVVDVNGYLPQVVKVSAERLRDKVAHYLFISTVSVYADMSQPINEDSPLARIENPNTELTNETYGALKVWCERYVKDVYADRACIVRPAFVIGPHDHTDRYPYWLWRAGRGGRMLTPGEDTVTAAIDARDLGEWVTRLAESQISGVFNAQAPVDLGESIQIARELQGADIQLIPLSVALAEKHELLNGQLPMWAPGAENAGMRAADNRRAVQAGLRLRSLSETVADTLAWIKAREAAGGHSWQAGLGAEEEAQLIEEITAEASTR